EPGADAALRWLRRLAAQRETPDGDPGGLGFALVLKSLGEVGESEVWRAYGGSDLARESIDTWLDAIITGIQGFDIRRFQRARALASEIGRLHPTLVAPVIERLLTLVTSESHDVSSRASYEAAGVLAGLHTPQTDELLVALLTGPDRRIRDAVAPAVFHWERLGPLDPLPALRHDERGKVRLAAIRALEHLGDRAPIEPLLEVLHDPKRWIHDEAAMALAALGPRAPLDT